jgi:hypothetical protein
VRAGDSLTDADAVPPPLCWAGRRLGLLNSPADCRRAATKAIFYFSWPMTITWSAAGSLNSTISSPPVHLSLVAWAHRPWLSPRTSPPFHASAGFPWGWSVERPSPRIPNLRRPISQATDDNARSALDRTVILGPPCYHSTFHVGTVALCTCSILLNKPSNSICRRSNDNTLTTIWLSYQELLSLKGKVIAMGQQFTIRSTTKTQWKEPVEGRMASPGES